MDKVKVLFLAANPQGTKNRLNLDKEHRAITEKVYASEYRDYLQVESSWATRPDDLLQSLNRHRPHIVHFSGHGSQTGELTLVDNTGSPKAVSTSALKALFMALKDNIQVVVLNACYSRSQAMAITKVINCVVGMKDAIGDEAAIIFAASFYRALGFGYSVQNAFDQGKVALMLEGIPEENTPKLLVRSGLDPSQIFLVERPIAKQQGTSSVPTQNTLDKPFSLGTMIMIIVVSHQSQKSSASDHRGDEAANIIGKEYAKFFSVQEEYHQAINANELESVMKFVTNIATSLSLIYPAPVEACFSYGVSIILYLWLSALFDGVPDELLLGQGHTKDEVRALERKIEGYADRSELPELKSYFKKIKGQRLAYSQKAELITQEITEYLRKISF